MPIRAPLAPVDIVDLCDGVIAGVTREAVAEELAISLYVAAKYTAHLPDGTRRDLVRAAILERDDRGESLDAIASLEACSLSFVARVLHAREFERRARAALANEDTPRGKRAKKTREVEAPRPVPAGSLLATLEKKKPGCTLP